MDRFMEQVVVKNKRALNEILYYLSFVLMVISGLFGLMQLSVLFSAFSIAALVMALVPIGIAVGLYFTRGQLRTEYEYTFTNGELDFAKVFNNQKRKNLGSLKVKNVEAFGKVTDSSFQRYATMQNIQKMNWFLNREAELYYFYFQKEGNKKMIVFEPNEEMVAYIKAYVPYGCVKV